MSGFLDKMGNFFFKEVDEQEQQEADSGLQAAPSVWQQQDQGERKTRKTNLITVPGKGGAKGQDIMEMILIKASSYDDMQEIANHIKARKVAVVNFEEMDKETAQRMVDFLSGAVYALDGVPRKVSNGTFIFSSSNVDLSGQIMERDSTFGEFSDERFSSTSWLRNK